MGYALADAEELAELLQIRVNLPDVDLLSVGHFMGQLFQILVIQCILIHIRIIPRACEAVKSICCLMSDLLYGIDCIMDERIIQQKD